MGWTMAKPMVAVPSAAEVQDDPCCVVTGKHRPIAIMHAKGLELADNFRLQRTSL